MNFGLGFHAAVTLSTASLRELYTHWNVIHAVIINTQQRRWVQTAVSTNEGQLSSFCCRLAFLPLIARDPEERAIKVGESLSAFTLFNIKRFSWSNVTPDHVSFSKRTSIHSLRSSSRTDFHPISFGRSQSPRRDKCWVRNSKVKLLWCKRKWLVLWTNVRVWKWKVLFLDLVSARPQHGTHGRGEALRRRENQGPEQPCLTFKPTDSKASRSLRVFAIFSLSAGSFCAYVTRGYHSNGR